MTRTLLTLLFSATLANAAPTNGPPFSPYVTLSGPEALPMYDRLRTNTVARFNHRMTDVQTLVDAIADELEDHPAFDGQRFSSILQQAKRRTRANRDPFAAVGVEPFGPRPRTPGIHSIQLQHTSFLNLFVALAIQSGHILMIRKESLAFVHVTASSEPIHERTYRKLHPATVNLIVDIPSTGLDGLDAQPSVDDPFATQSLNRQDFASLSDGFGALGITHSSQGNYQYSERAQTLRVQQTLKQLGRIDAIIDVISPVSDTAHLVNAAVVSQLTINQQPARQAIDQLSQSTITGFTTPPSSLSAQCNILLVVPPDQLDTPITLTLHSTSIKSALNAICDQTGWRYELQAQQIVFYGGPLHTSEAKTQMFRLKDRASRSLVEASSPAEFFADLGVTIPAGSALRYIPHAHMLAVRSTRAAVAGIKRSLDEIK